MSEQSTTIPKTPKLQPAEDFYALRREGIGFIEQMGSHLWTDYNTHDPGITILDALCYAMTDLAYRTRWAIEDLLASAMPAANPEQPYPNQPFFTARTILTVNPWTPDDFRRLLIDLDLVRNAWVFCREEACAVAYYAWCEEEELILAYQSPPNPLLIAKKVEPRGLVDVLLELEADPVSGDLNDRKIEHSFEVDDPLGAFHTIDMELRFPAWELAKPADWERFLHNDDAFAEQNGASFSVSKLRFGATKTYDLLTDPTLTLADQNAYLWQHWRTIFYVSFELTFQPSGEIVTIEAAALRLRGSSTAREQVTMPKLRSLLEDPRPDGFIQRYRNKLLKVEAAVKAAKTLLHTRRNLDEDYCRITGVTIEDVAVCADVEVTPDADIERIQAQLWFAIEQYFNPPVPFYTLDELQQSQIPVEEIFNGPALDHGFIKAAELAAAQLKAVLRTSDLINLLMDIEGVLAVNNLLLSKYDAEGNVIPGAADPTWENGAPVFDPNKSSALWVLYISDLHQPRLYHNQSRFLFYKNGLPFTPRRDEAADTLTQLRGESERPKIQHAPNDLPLPVGTVRNLDAYPPLQDTFPFTYGIGPDGLPSTASIQRRAQARQLQAYLLVFDQLLGNMFAQVAHTASLFSLDPTIAHTYFVRELSEALLPGYTAITNGLDAAKVAAMTESQPEFLERRNRFLDHIMARFGEQFSEYALLLTNQQGQQVALDRLIQDKISFLNAYPSISRDRGKAFNYGVDPCRPDNIAGLKKRVSLLLGYPDLHFSWQVTNLGPGQYNVAFRLLDQYEGVWFTGQLAIAAVSPSASETPAFQQIITRMSQPAAYAITPAAAPFRLQLQAPDGALLGQSPKLFATEEDAQREQDELVGWSSNERAILVEHLLLRPKFPGDALYPACTDGPCTTCGEEDPYSFRLTFVMPGWAPPFHENLAMRGFADRTIRQETPAHLLSKICWVGNDGFIVDPCDPVIDELARTLATQGLTAAGVRPTVAEACDCAAAIYAAFSAVFQTWYEDKTLDHFQPDLLQTTLTVVFGAKINPVDLSCTTLFDAALWAAVMQIMVRYFQRIAIEGWQFERFADAWCQWLAINAEFDWTEERLQERVAAILAGKVEPTPATGSTQKDALNRCAAAILTAYGTAFYNWLAANIKAGNTLANLTVFTPAPIALCPDFTFKADTAASVAAFLQDRYDRYKAVSYRLWIVVQRLSELRSIYPPATLHDCDDGSDQNPVRLGQTVLGNW